MNLPPQTVVTEKLGSATDLNELAELLGTTSRRLRHLLYRLSPKKRYRDFDIKKRNGDKRRIRAPILPLKKLQKRIAEMLEAQYEPRSCVFGYVKGANILKNARCHKNRRWVLRVDLKNFFPTIHFGRVRGMLMAPPFSLSPPVATIVAQICCVDNELPQGSPASPVISNIICRGLDHALSKLARTQRCRYTRYCDDLVFSTNGRTFPPMMAQVNPGDQKATVGPFLQQELETADFEVNPSKVQLRFKSQRQMVTGLIVNEAPNVPRQLVRDIRMMLHVWRKLGEDQAANWYLTKHDKRNRPPEKQLPIFRYLVRGKIQYIGSIKGWSDPVYVRLAKRLARLDATFRLTKKVDPSAPADLSLDVYGEGKTDSLHIEAALKSFQTQGRFKGLKLKFSKEGSGDTELLRKCKHYAASQQPHFPPCVFVFDHDNDALLKEVEDEGRPFKDWKNGVFSLALPRPPHRTGNRWCVEMLYTDTEIAKDVKGRRFFLADEFDEANGHHKRLPVHARYPAKKDSPLVISESVFRKDNGQDISLSKTAFAENKTSQPVGEVDFSGFAPLFELLTALRNHAAATPAAEGDAEQLALPGPIKS